MHDNLSEKPFASTWLALKTDVEYDNTRLDVTTTNNILPLCYCHYPQPPDADLITVDSTYTKSVRRNSDSKGTPPNGVRRKSLWTLPKKFTINCVIFVGSLFCFD